MASYENVLLKHSGPRYLRLWVSSCSRQGCLAPLAEFGLVRTATLKFQTPYSGASKSAKELVSHSCPQGLRSSSMLQSDCRVEIPKPLAACAIHAVPCSSSVDVQLFALPTGASGLSLARAVACPTLLLLLLLQQLTSELVTQFT